MVKKTKKYLITTTSHEVIVVRNPGRIVVEYCPRCRVETEFVSFDLVVREVGSQAEVLVLIANGTLHPLKTSNGRQFVCRNSLTGETHEEPNK